MIDISPFAFDQRTFTTLQYRKICIMQWVTQAESRFTSFIVQLKKYSHRAVFIKSEQQYTTTHTKHNVKN